MPTHTDRIKAGLDARARESDSHTIPLSSLVGAPASLKDLSDLTSKALAKRDRLRVLSESVTSALAKYREQKTAEYARLGKVRTADGSIIDEIGDNKRRAMLERDVSAYAREARKSTAEERATLASELRQFVALIEPVRASWLDPVALLNRRTLAEPKRATYAANLAAAGPVALETALRDATITGNAALAAAAIDKLDGLPKDDRKHVRFSRTEVATAMVADELAKARQFIEVAEIAAQEAELANAEAEGKRTAAGEKIRLGLRKRDLRKVTGEPEPGSPEALEAAAKPKVLSEEEWRRSLDARYPGRPIPDNVTVIGRAGDD